MADLIMVVEDEDNIRANIAEFLQKDIAYYCNWPRTSSFKEISRTNSPLLTSITRAERSASITMSYFLAMPFLRDIRDKFLRQVSTAVGDGATAATAAERYIEEQEDFNRNVVEATQPETYFF